MATASIKKIFGLDLLSGLNDRLRASDKADSSENTLPTPDSDQPSNGSTISLISKISQTPTFETIEDSLPPSPKYGLPVNFAEVTPGIYRSSFPQSTNFEHLADLGLKTVLTLVTKEYTEEYLQFIDSYGIQHIQISIPPNKGALATIPLESMIKALSLVSDTRNHPILVHCNKGKHRTGCVIGCYRKMCDWPMEKILSEYRRYAGSKARLLDEKYISEFDQEEMIECLNDVAYHKAKENMSLLTPPASERSMASEL